MDEHHGHPVTPKELARAEQVEREAETAAQERKRLRLLASRPSRFVLKQEPEGEYITIGIHDECRYWDAPPVSECMQLIPDARDRDLT
jgi:hypothetical protein